MSGRFGGRPPAAMAVDDNEGIPMRLTVNGKAVDIEADPQMPLLWALRDLANIKGPKFGCGIAACGACTVLVDGAPVRSCSLPVGMVEGDILTIEGLAVDGKLHPVQQAWLEEQVAQCGYCQAGQIMSAVALLDEVDEPSDEDIDNAMGGNLCRCGTYPRIRAAIRKAAAIKLAGA
jgi:isoquinoline 1-oxidoreductase alpha subunit